MLGLVIWTQQYLAVILAICVSAAYLMYPRSKKAPVDGKIPWYDALSSFLILASGIYLTIRFEAIFYTTSVSWLTVLFGIIAIVLMFEITRRLIGWPLLIICTVLLVYMAVGSKMPGALYIPPIPFDRAVAYLYTDSSALIGTPLWVSATMLLAFFLLGNVITEIGAGRFIMDFAFKLVGRFRGGPAKIAIFSSGLFGTISGSSAANVVITGVITIPMMKKIGYPAHKAGGIEAAASTGGLLMPPIMGQTSFLIATFLCISYSTVILAALIPAVLYYMALFMQADADAARYNVKTYLPEELPPWSNILKRSYTIVIPLAVLLYILFVLHYEPDKAAVITAFICIIAGLIASRGRLIFRIPAIFANTGGSVAMLCAIGAMAGLMVGALTRTGLSFSLGLWLVILGEHSTLALTICLAAGCIILGMGTPAIVIYIMLATIAGAAIEQLGLLPLAGHLFIFFMGTTGLITPPFCPAAYAASPIAQSNPFSIGWAAVKFGIAAFMVPFLFLFNTGILLQGTPGEIISDTVMAIATVFLMASGLSGYFFKRPMNRLEQICAIGIPTIFCLLQGLQSQYVFWGGQFLIFGFLAYLLLKSYFVPRVNNPPAS